MVAEWSLPKPPGKTVVHAFQIKELETIEWMNWDMGYSSSFSYTAHITHPIKDRFSISPAAMKMFNPSKGWWIVVWPIGLITFRSPESFARDFEPGNGSLFYTELESIFQRGFLHPPAIEARKKERDAERERKRQEIEARRIQREQEGVSRAASDALDNLMIRRVIPWLVPMPKAFIDFPPAQGDKG